MAHLGLLVLKPKRKLKVTRVKTKKKTTLGKVTLTRRKRTFRERRAKLPKVLRALTSPVLTAVLGGTLAVLAFPAAAATTALAAAKGIGRFAVKRPITTVLGIPTAIGALTVSPTLRKALDPRARLGFGKQIGEVVEDPSTFIQKLTSIGREVAPVAVVAGLTGATLAAIGRVAGRKKDIAIPSLLPAAAAPVGALAQSIPLAAAPSIPAAVPEPLGAVQQEKPPEIAKVPKAVPMVRITNKPQNNINIRFSKSRKFINQQVLVNR